MDHRGGSAGAGGTDVAAGRPKEKARWSGASLGWNLIQKICGTGCHLGRTRKYNRIGDAGVPVLSHSPSVLENGTGENR